MFCGHLRRAWWCFSPHSWVCMTALWRIWSLWGNGFRVPDLWGILKLHFRDCENVGESQEARVFSMNSFLWDFRTKCFLLRKCQCHLLTLPGGSHPQPVCWTHRALPLWAQVVEMLPCAHTHLLWHISTRSCSLSVVQEVFSLLLGVSIRSKMIQSAEQRPGKHLLPSALMVASMLEFLVAFFV